MAKTPQDNMAKTRSDNKTAAAVGGSEKNDGQLAKNKGADEPLWYNGSILNIPSTIEQMEKMLRKVVKNMEVARVKNATLMDQNTGYREELAGLLKAAMKTRKNNKVCANIKKLWQTHMFRNTKFIQDENDEAKAAALAYNFTFPTKEREKLAKENKNHEAIWCNTCGPVVTSKANSRRSYIQGRLKNAMVKFAKVMGYMPTIAELIQCAMRTIDIDKDRGFAVMKLYWTEIMRKFWVIV